jgi:hypothetical protein
MPLLMLFSCICLQVLLEYRWTRSGHAYFLLFSELKMPCVGKLDCSSTEPVEVLPKFVVKRMNYCRNVMPAAYLILPRAIGV